MKEDLPPQPSILKFSLSPTWLLLLPLGLWGIAMGYVAVLGAFLETAGIWLYALFIEVLAVLAIVIHTLAHIWAARQLSSRQPERLPITVFGDAAQVWPAGGIRQEVLTALAAPLANLILAGAAYELWNLQIHPLLNVSMPFIAIFNVWLAAVNLTPVFPMDGGRITRALLFPRLRAQPGWRSKSPEAIARIETRLGFTLAAALVAWGIFLIAQQARFSLETGGSAILFAALLALELILHPARPAGEPLPVQAERTSRPLPILAVALILLALLAAASTALLTNNALEAPGVALSVEPMVELPAAYRHTHTGTFILTSVISQSPIPAGLWYLGKLTPLVKILPPEQNLPNELSPQEEARQGYEMLDQSETTALVIGLQLAGFPATISGKGVEVVSIIPESHANGILQPGDVITSLDGKPIRTLPELTNQLQVQKAGDIIHLTAQRNQKPVQAAVQLLAPSAPDNPPRIGILGQTSGFDAHLPFPASIVPQKIVGGPSAGLMFTLTVYNALIPEDLTGGRRIAGTGTINPDGTVGPIGGVQQKVLAAEYAGAEYFLSPPENYADALAAARHIKVIKIATAKQAVNFLKSLPPPP